MAVRRATCGSHSSQGFWMAYCFNLWSRNPKSSAESRKFIWVLPWFLVSLKIQGWTHDQKKPVWESHKWFPTCALVASLLQVDEVLEFGNSFRLCLGICSLSRKSRWRPGEIENLKFSFYLMGLPRISLYNLLLGSPPSWLAWFEPFGGVAPSNWFVSLRPWLEWFLRLIFGKLVLSLHE